MKWKPVWDVEAFILQTERGKYICLLNRKSCSCYDYGRELVITSLSSFLSLCQVSGLCPSLTVKVLLLKQLRQKRTVENYDQYFSFLASASSATAGHRRLLKERILETGSTEGLDKICKLCRWPVDWISLERRCWYPLVQGNQLPGSKDWLVKGRFQFSSHWGLEYLRSEFVASKTSALTWHCSDDSYFWYEAWEINSNGAQWFLYVLVQGTGWSLSRGWRRRSGGYCSLYRVSLPECVVHSSWSNTVHFKWRLSDHQ